jgi:5-dehydro-2-deoxygluconokinase
MRALEAAADLPYWIGRPIELPQSCPLSLIRATLMSRGDRAMAAESYGQSLFLYHPDDDPTDLRERQERQALRLFDACRATRHELLVEIIASKNGAVDSKTVARAIQRFYDIGVRPDWWKLEPAADARAWANIERAILANDPHCRGVVLLGLSSAAG